MNVAQRCQNGTGSVLFSLHDEPALKMYRTDKSVVFLRSAAKDPNGYTPLRSTS